MTRITVGVRIKPDNDDEIMKNFNHNTNAHGGGAIDMTVNGTKHEFNFDFIFDVNAQQSDVFDKCAISVIDSVMDGYNGTLFAYGQTGAGKTHTVMGPSVETYEDRGLCLRTIDYLFKTVHQASKKRSYIIKLSVIEIYNDIVIDLLREDKVEENRGDIKKQPPPKLIIMDTPEGVVIPALYLFPIDSEDDAYVKITEANLNRAVAEHQLNRRSSRSHAIYTFHVTQSPVESTVTDGSDVEQSKLHLVDLAGSERIEKTGSKGGLIKEATHINKSLSFLEQVVLALTKQAGASAGAGAGVGGAAATAGVVASYRQSKLTYILKDSLGGNCNTLLIGCVWPHKQHVWETLSTLRFATRMKCIENQPKRNALVTGGSNSSTRALQNTIEALKRELMMRDAIHSYSRQGLQATSMKLNGNNIVTDNRQTVVYTETLTMNQQAVSVNMACEYAGNGSVELSLPDILGVRELELKSLSQAQAVAASLRCALWHACGGDEVAVQAALTKMKESFAGRSQQPGSQSQAHYTPKKPAPRPADSPMLQKPSIIDDNDREGGDVSGGGVERVHPPALQRSQLHPPVANSAPSQPQPEPKPEPEPELQQVTVHESQPSPSPIKIAATTPQDSLDPFEHFKTTEGLHHHNKYEEAKRSLKELKQLQKTLVVSVNTAKASIDSTSERINELNSETIATLRESSEKEINELKVTLAEFKTVYRQERGKLLKVKEELAAGTLQKQQYLKNLVTAYEEHRRVSVSEGQDDLVES